MINRLLYKVIITVWELKTNLINMYKLPLRSIINQNPEILAFFSSEWNVFCNYGILQEIHLAYIPENQFLCKVLSIWPKLQICEQITTSLEQRCYKELRNENFQSTKIVMCIYKKLLISCKEQMWVHPSLEFYSI